jgi:hypothetical chaperone protein
MARPAPWRPFDMSASGARSRTRDQTCDQTRNQTREQTHDHTRGKSPACAIDFGTSNSSIALLDAGHARLVELEAGQRTMPTAVFYAVEGLAAHEDPLSLFGRAAIAAYVEGVEGRLMRSMKSILGSSLADQATEVGQGRSVRYLDVVAGYLRHLKAMAEQQAGHEIDRAVLGRPVFFVDDDPVRDAAAQEALARAARSVGLRELSFQFEPIAAALDYETRVAHEQMVLVADLGGGTSDFSLVRVGPERSQRIDRAADILANHGVHVAGTDFDRHLELAFILPHCGFKGRTPDGREVPSRVYFDLATWHLINTVYTPQRAGELQRMKSFYADVQQHARLMTVVGRRLGHALLGRAEQAKIEVAEHGRAVVALDELGSGLADALEERAALAAIDADCQRIAEAAQETVRLAGLRAEQVQALYFTGGSTGLRALSDRIAAGFPRAEAVHGDRLASVAQGLGQHALKVFH